MTTPRLAFLDWLKCLGMAAIVFWHVSTYAERLIPPIYPKQLGVAFFLFSAGFTLARERRPTGEVLYNRLFEIYLFGIGFALLMSGVRFAQVRDLNESNYLPFALGANVGFNDFPANPTTWYIGTYLHVLLLWGVALRGVRIRPWMLVATCLAEVAIRAALAEACGLFVAYMALSNWATVFLLGIFTGQRADEEPRTGPVPWLAGLAALVAGWALIAGPLVTRHTFPFMTMTTGPKGLGLAVRSASASFVYVAFTWMTYQVARRLPDLAPVRFLARNTLIVFIAHMPLYYLLEGPVRRWTGGDPMRTIVLSLACFPALAIVSEGIVRLVRPKALRDRLRRLVVRPERIPARPVAEVGG